MQRIRPTAYLDANAILRLVWRPRAKNEKRPCDVAQHGRSKQGVTYGALHKFRHEFW